MNFNKFKEATEENVGKVDDVKDIKTVNDYAPADIFEKKEKPVKVEKPAAKKKEFGRAEVSVNVRLEPSFEGEILATLYPNARIQILGKQDGWYKAFYQGRECYVKKEYIILEADAE